MADITVPNTFTAHATAYSAQVNANFAALTAGALNKAGDTMTGGLVVINGSSAVPSVAATGGTTTGIYFPGGNTFSVSLANSQKLLLDGSGLTVCGLNILNASGKIPAISSTYFASLDGAALTGVAAATVTNGVYTSGSYTNPDWIVTLAKAKVGLGSVEDTALSTWTGANTIATVGTITTGVWHGSVVAPAYLGTGTPSGSNYLRGDGTWAAVSGAAGGTVTSVAASMPTQFSVTGSPITSAGTLAIAWANQDANYILAGPTTGGASAPTFRKLDENDLPTVTIRTTQTYTKPLWLTQISGTIVDGAISGAAGSVTWANVSGKPAGVTGTLTNPTLLQCVDGVIIAWSNT